MDLARSDDLANFLAHGPARHAERTSLVTAIA
jgi:hypothetical protein